MSVRLVVRQRSEEGDAGEGKEVILAEPLITLGRDKTCQVHLPLQAVSRNHARISQDGALFFVEDLGSVYGTQVNGQPLPQGEKRLLRDGDLITIAQFDISFDRMPDLPASEAPDHTSMVARHMVKDAMRAIGSGEAPYLRFMNGPDEGKHIQLSEARELILGRDEDVDVVLKDDLVSRKHAKIRRDWAGTHLEDLGSRNGIRVNKKRVTRKTLTDRDEVEVGGVKFLYVDPTEVQDSRVGPVSVPDDEEEHTPPPDPEPEAEPEPEEEEPSEAGSEEAGEDPPAEEEAAADAPEAEGDPLASLEDAGGNEAEPPMDDGGFGDFPEQSQGGDGPPIKQKVEIQQWVVLGLAAAAALCILGLVAFVLAGG